MKPAAFKTIVAAVDLSDLSAHALRQAAKLARAEGGKVIAAYVNWFEAPPYFTASQVDELRRTYRANAHKAEASLKNFVEAHAGGFTDIQTRVVDGFPATGILRIAEQENADLIALGTHGRSGYNRWMLGSVAERVLRESPAPVLTVRAAGQENLRHILCPVEDSEVSRRALEEAAMLAGRHGAAVTAMHVGGGPSPIANLCAWIPAEVRSRCELRETLRRGDPAGEIITMAEEGAYDLIVLGSPRKKFLGGMVIGTTALRVVRHASAPVLSIP